ncbi:MAG TPA: hypothetical protein VMU64_02675 [Acidimicrobiales bacterium]|nr:hypothetical protein [Acidimicrobiales bacterium]
MPEETLTVLLTKFSHLVETWGRDPQFFVEWFIPSLAGNPTFVDWAGGLQQQSASPADFERQRMSIRTLDASSARTRCYNGSAT